ncbi:MAG: 30S ribosomal protein S8 [Micavibrio aeruginosavorus]|uniref:Small ribosomal subunit protein uS8 n=1 Tax=Micavibrio aeruginosavorus TaxID=349221 RepID=A0A2W5MVI6_9BACT|nr:MAG: 30S ribosomal protein S8 [Micavibrio aeruginosavorus]
MSMNDPLSDMLTRIRNGQNARLPKITAPYSKLLEAVCKVLTDEGFIRGYKTVDAGTNKKELSIELKYDAGQPVIRELKRVSKPGRRVYTQIKGLGQFYNGLGIKILSTPQGVMADHKAKAANVGGEVLCQVF